MKHYYLFLDETKPNPQFQYFCLGGIFIEKEIYEKQLIPLVNTLKTATFGNTSTILHESEFRNPKKTEFMFLKVKANEEKYWSDVATIFKTVDFKTIGVGLDIVEYDKLYNTKNKNDMYHVSMQIIMENFTHFLEAQKATGSIHVESTNQKEDLDLQNKFYTLKAHGTLFLGCNAHQSRLTTINFPLKSSNDVGLQIADMIPNPLAREMATRKQKNFSLLPEIKNNLYNGGFGLEKRFGFKLIP